jgi:molecular chaperone IbpA
MTRTLTLRGLDIPSIHKFGIGFDNMLDELARITTQQNQTNYPPYNVVKHTEDKFSIEVAVAGFAQGDISVKLENQVLTIAGSKAAAAGAEFLHQGISNRDFTREFTLAEHVEVTGASSLNGILTINLERIIPEDKKPKLVEIKYLT